jgi:hypothetical protein
VLLKAAQVNFRLLVELDEEEVGGWVADTPVDGLDPEVVAG